MPDNPILPETIDHPVPEKDWPTIMIAIVVSGSPESVRVAFALPPKSKKMIDEYLRDQRHKSEKNPTASDVVGACKALFDLVAKLAYQHTNDKKHILTPFSKIIPFLPPEA